MSAGGGRVSYGVLDFLGIILPETAWSSQPMMTDTMELATFFDLPEYNIEVVEQYADAAHISFQTRERFDTLVNEHAAKVESGQGDALRVALGLTVLGRYQEALEQFEKTPASVVRHVYASQANAGLGRYDAALEDLKAAVKQGWDAFEADMRAAEIHVRAGAVDAAQKLLDQYAKPGADRAAWHFVQGVVAEANEDNVAASEAYDEALKLDTQHVPTLFRAARLFDLLGDDEEALRLYEHLSQQPRAHINALVNAAVIYEDVGRYDEAALCLRRVLKVNPNHARARLFFKDVESCRDMIIDETGGERVDARTRLLDTPLSEYELSVRARNCLKKMNIRTLGELVELSEAELLAYKNFGETSLAEIKQLLDRKGLRLGQRVEEMEVAEAPAETPVAAPVRSPGQEAVLAKPVSDLELSVRARRCLQRLNVQTLGDLLQYTEQDLLSTRNFGVTSLTEVKARLAEHDLALATKKA